MATSPDGRQRREWCQHELRRSVGIDARYCSDCSERCRSAANRQLARHMASYTAGLEFQDLFHHNRDSVPRCPACGDILGRFVRGHPDQPDYQYRRDRRYCSAVCRTRAWRARQRRAAQRNDKASR